MHLYSGMKSTDTEPRRVVIQPYLEGKEGKKEGNEMERVPLNII